jgi:hypothetical protein
MKERLVFVIAILLLHRNVRLAEHGLQDKMALDYARNIFLWPVDVNRKEAAQKKEAEA